MRTRSRSWNRYVVATGKKIRATGYPSVCSTIIEEPYSANLLFETGSETMVDEEPVNGALRPERSCHHVKTVVTAGTGTCRVVYPGIYTAYELPSPYNVGIPSSASYLAMPSYTLPDLLSEILEKEDPASQIWAGMPFIGEFKSTVQMLKNPLSFLKKLHVPRGMRQRPLGEVLTKLGLDKASNAWLQYQYGWAPLMGDLRAVSQGYQRMYSDYTRFMNGSGSVVCSRKLARNLGTVTSRVDKTTYYQVKTATHLVKVNCKFRVKPARATGKAMTYPEFVAHKLGFSLSQIASTAWELAPYSVIADWFIPVGDTLNRISKLPSNLDVLSQSYHHTAIQEVQHWWTQVPSSSNTFCAVGPLPAKPNYIEGWTARNTSYWRNWVGHTPEGYVGASGLTTKRTISALSMIAQRLMCPLPR